MLKSLKSYTRPNEAFLISIQVLSFIIFLWSVFSSFSLYWWALAGLGYFAMFGLGITVTFHRLMAHRSYTVWKPIEYLFALFANLGCTGSSIGWIFVHRAHHKFSDKPGDPHSPIVHGRLGAIIGQYGQGFDKWMVRDIVNDRVHRFYHDYYNLLIAVFPIILFAIKFELFVFLFAIPVFLNTMASRLSNWIDHEPKFGVRKNHSNDFSHNVWWWSLLTFGEGWHNNHHAFPWSYRFGLKWYEIDVGQYVIRFLRLIRLADFKSETPGSRHDEGDFDLAKYSVPFFKRP